MITSAITPERLAASVIAVPPLARKADFSFDRQENKKLIRHLESGGVTTLLYGGNANIYHVRLSEYEKLLQLLRDVASAKTLVIPSAGPAYGAMMDQAGVLREFDFPTAMILPQQGVSTPAGVETAVRHFVDAFGRPAVLYLKHDGFISVDGVERLSRDGLLSGIKYAIVRDDPAKDGFLSALVDLVNPKLIISGIGEQPAIAHVRDFGLGGFTSGCVCIAPRLSMNMLRALQAGDLDTAEQIRRTFRPLEDLRNAISPIRVQHDAVTFSQIANMGPILPLLNNLEPAHRENVEHAAVELLRKNSQMQFA
jgi:dihydrodipicolinate synthase/N-acetylneuraminate lyase